MWRADRATSPGRRSVGIGRRLKSLSALFKLVGFGIAAKFTEGLGLSGEVADVYGTDNFQLTLPVAGLCQAYDASGQSEKAAACHARMVSLIEKQYGPDTPYLVRLKDFQ